MKEREWQAKVVETCNWLGLRHYHTFDSRRSVAGYPDLTVVGPYGVVFFELKSPKGRVTPQQEAWIADLQKAGQMAMVVRPHDFDYVLTHLKRIAGK